MGVKTPDTTFRILFTHLSNSRLICRMTSGCGFGWQRQVSIDNTGIACFAFGASLAGTYESIRDLKRSLG